MSIWLAFIITTLASVAWLRFNNFLASRNYVSNQLSRKLVHIGTGPIFVLCWLFFPETSLSPYVAALIPLLITVQFFLVGIGVVKDQSSVDALSRSGNRREILKGPLIYGLVFVVLTILFWRNSLVGITALMVLCGGDGLADVVGRRAKSGKIPWSQNKTIAGSLAMFIGGLVFSLGIGLIFNSVYSFGYTIGSLIVTLVIINLVAAIVETFPVFELDNLTVPLVSVIFGLILFL